MRKKKTPKGLVLDRLAPMRAYGESRHIDKFKNRTETKIYSKKTYDSYVLHCTNFMRWARQNYHRLNTLEDALPYTQEYLQGRIDAGISAWTIQAERSALAKLYGVPGETLHDNLPEKRRRDITNNRGEKVHDKHVNLQNYPELVLIATCTGLRRSELARIRGNDLVIDRHGNASLSVTAGTKGGKTRTALICATDAELERIQSIFASAGSQKVILHIPRNLNTHALRREYANKMYTAEARDISRIPNKADRYHCRGDKAGTVYDRQALFKISKSMGHNRENVIAESYLD